MYISFCVYVCTVFSFTMFILYMLYNNAASCNTVTNKYIAVMIGQTVLLCPDLRREGAL